MDPQNKRVTDDQGTAYAYGKLLLATGGTPRHLPFGGEQIIYFRTLDDYQHLRALTTTGQHFAVIGGGFIGSEVAAALAMNSKKVVMAFPEAGIGIQPNVELAQAAGLEVENGIRVDASLRTSHPDIYAAGDVANFYNPALDKRLRLEHEDNANTMGRLAGQAMAGRTVIYDHLPFFYSDLFELGYEAVGEVDSRLQTVADWKEPYREGVIYYLRDGRVRGVLLWNVWEQVDAARKLIAQPGPFRPESLKGRLPA